MRARRVELIADRGLGGAVFCKAYAGAADRWLSSIFEHAVKEAGGDGEGVALVAVGGYGRSELSPGSDLDVVLVHEGRSGVDSLAKAVWYPVWNDGVKLDHSVRRPKEVLSVARSDMRAMLGLLDARHVAGDRNVSDPLVKAVIELWRREVRRFLPELGASIVARHEVQGEVAFLLEPDLKEARGGLRDVHAIRAILLAEGDDPELDGGSSPTDAEETLLAARVELQRCSGRATNRLVLQEQDAVASALGLEDADVLMSRIAEAGRAVAWNLDYMLQRLELRKSAALGKAARPAKLGRLRWDIARRLGVGAPETGVGARRAEPPAPEARNLGAGEPAGSTRVPVSPASTEWRERAVSEWTADSGDVIISGSEVLVSPVAHPGEDWSLALRVAAVAAYVGLPIARSSLLWLADSAGGSATQWPLAARDAFVATLAAGRAGIGPLEALDQVGILTRIIPEWAAVRNRPQRNAYHRFTVDRHLLETAAIAAAWVDRVSRPDLLLVGAVLHDIGKGYPGDHTTEGMRVVADISERMGFGKGDVETLVTMVRHHLLLADMATRRDLDDPATIDTVAGAVGDHSTLDLLFALTEADSLATGSGAWGPWKEGLVLDLVARVSERLAGQPERRRDDFPSDAHRRVMKRRRTEIFRDGETVTVIAPDRPGLLSTVAGLLALHRLDIRSASAASEDGMAVEVFKVSSRWGRWPDDEALASELEGAVGGAGGAVEGRPSISERLVARKREYEVAMKPTSARAAPAEVNIENNASALSTVVEVRAPDSIGLLHRVTGALFACDLDVVSARVSTIGDQMVDAFYVRVPGGGKVQGPEDLERIKRAVAEALAAG